MVQEAFEMTEKFTLLHPEDRAARYRQCFRYFHGTRISADTRLCALTDMLVNSPVSFRRMPTQAPRHSLPLFFRLLVASRTNSNSLQSPIPTFWKVNGDGTAGLKRCIDSIKYMIDVT